MKTGQKRNRRGALKSLLRRTSKAAFLAGSLFVSTFSVAKASEVKRGQETIGERVKTVREELSKKLDDSQGLPDKLSYAEREVAQWGNWGNWNDWRNWNNWNNWRNWNNWGNWRNY
ncbi:MAG TPA: hypothetical protein VK421_09275 [Pyrinomonadaceae bacterium]|nr:hypothetical protein [Pyrinomonadaceae bacterium]